MKKILIAASLAVLLAACTKVAPPTTDDQQAREQERTAQEAAQQVGLPRVPNNNELKMAVKIMEARDNPNLLTYIYEQGMDGKLICLGKGIGFGLPYATEITNPQRVAHGYETPSTGNVTLPQADPNHLYMPAAADATWAMLIDPKDGTAKPVYSEPKLTVSPFSLHGPAIAVPCSDDDPRK